MTKRYAFCSCVFFVFFALVCIIGCEPQVTEWSNERNSKLHGYSPVRNRTIQSHPKVKKWSNERNRKLHRNTQLTERESQRMNQSKKAVNDFLKVASPELLTKLDEIKLEKTKLASDILKLEELKKSFPDQSALIDKRIDILQSISMKHSESIYIINSEARTSYVLHKIDEIGGKKSIQKSSARLMNKAEESIKYAQQMRQVLEELTKH